VGRTYPWTRRLAPRGAPAPLGLVKGQAALAAFEADPEFAEDGADEPVEDDESDEPDDEPDPDGAEAAAGVDSVDEEDVDAADESELLPARESVR
jgi:hypothetical protein